MTTSKTPANAQRANVLIEYRSRGRANRNLWLVYSIKTDLDWILPSDKHFLLWLTYLECNPDIRSFRFVDEVQGKDVVLGNAASPVAIATRRDGTEEHHVVHGAVRSVGRDALERGGRGEPYVTEASVVRVATDEDLRGRAREAIRWLKIVSYATALRGQELTAQTVAVITSLRSLGSGTISSVLDSLPDFDAATILGILARMAILGDISFDLRDSNFTMRSEWHWRETR
jgi:hypothetical protein